MAHEHFVLPVINTRLIGNGFVMKGFEDVYFVYFGPKDLGHGDARGLSNLVADPAVRAALHVTQALISLARQAETWRRSSSIPPTVFGVARVPCRAGDQVNYGVLFLAIINSHRSVTNIRNQGGAARAPGPGGDDDEEGGAMAGAAPVPRAHARGRRPGAPMHPDGTTDHVGNMADMLDALMRARDEMSRQRRFGEGSRTLSITDNDVLSLGIRAFPDAGYQNRPDRSGFCTRHYQMDPRSALALDRILSPDVAIRQMRDDNAAPVFTNINHYRGADGGIFLNARLNFYQLLTSRVEPAAFPYMVFPWKWVPGPAVAQEISTILAREGPRAEGKTESEKKVWAVREILNQRDVKASDQVLRFRDLRQAQQERTNSQRSAWVLRMKDDPRFMMTGNPREDAKRRKLINTVVMRQHHRVIQDEFWPSMAQLLDPHTNELKNIKTIMSFLLDYSARQPLAQGASRTADRQWVVTTRGHRLYYNIHMYSNHIVGMMELAEVLGLKNTHNLLVIMHFAWLSVFLLSNQLTHLDITGPPSTGKSITAEVLRLLWVVKIIRTITKMTDNAGLAPDDDFRIQLVHEANQEDKRIGNSTKVKSRIDAGGDQSRTEMKKNEDGTWRPQTVTLEQNVVNTDLGNPDGRGDIDSAVRSRYFTIIMGHPRRADRAIPRIGNEIGGTAQFANVRIQYGVRACRAGLILLINQTMAERDGCTALRLLNHAMGRLAEQQVFDRFRSIKRVENQARSIAASRVAHLLFDIPGHSPFFGRPFSFNDLFWAVLRCYYIDVSDLVFAVTLMEENMDDEATTALRDAIMRVCFNAKSIPAARGTGGSTQRGNFAGCYVKARYSSRTAVERARAREQTEGAAAGRDDSDDVFAAAFDDMMNSADVNRVAFQVDKHEWRRITVDTVLHTSSSESKADSKEAGSSNNNTQQQTPQSRQQTLGRAWLPRQEQTAANVRALLDILVSGARDLLAKFPMETLRDRLLASTQIYEHIILSGQEGQPDVRRDRVVRLEFIDGNAVFCKDWLIRGKPKSLADHVLELMSFRYAPPEEEFLTGRVDPEQPLRYIITKVTRNVHTELMLPPIIDGDEETYKLCVRAVAPDAMLADDNTYLSRRVHIKTDLHTAGRQEHMRVNGFSRSDYKRGDLDIYNVVDHSYWNWPAEAVEKKYPPGPTVFGVGRGTDDTAVLDEAEVDDAEVEDIMRDDTRHDAFDDDGPGAPAAAEHMGDDAMPPLEQHLQHEEGPADFSAFMAPRPVVNDLARTRSSNDLSHGRRPREEEVAEEQPARRVRLNENGAGPSEELPPPMSMEAQLEALFL